MLFMMLPDNDKTMLAGLMSRWQCPSLGVQVGKMLCYRCADGQERAIRDGLRLIGKRVWHLGRGACLRPQTRRAGPVAR